VSDSPTTKVSIDTPPLAVTVEAPGVSLDDARAAALALYRDVWRPDMQATHMGGIGFSAERSGD
jgi:hypothetical protein